MIQTYTSLVELAAVLAALKLASVGFRWFGNFAQKSKVSNPFSRLLRPVVEWRRFRVILGINLAIAMVLVNRLGPIGGQVSVQPVEAALLTNGAVKVLTETTFRIPVEQTGGYSQGFHGFHPGVDLRAKRGTNIYPVASGIVTEVEMGRWAYGHKIVIEHEHNWVSLYAHLDQVSVKVGDNVTKDTVIGNVGMTGWTTGPHLHLEIKNNQGYLNPRQVLPEI